MQSDRETPQASSIERFDEDACPTRIKEALMSGRSISGECFRPESAAEVIEVVQALNARKQPFGVVAARSNVVGCFDGMPPTLISTERLDRIVSLDEVSQLVEVEAGVNAGRLEGWLNERGFTLGQYPQSLYISTVGGWLNTRATGSLSASFGGVESAIKGAEIVLPSGEVLRFGPRVRPAGGIDGLGVFIGSEGSLGVVIRLWLGVHRRQDLKVACFAFDSFATNIEAQRKLIQERYPVALLRGYNPSETKHIVPEAGPDDCLLIVGVSGPSAIADFQFDAVCKAAGGRRLADDAAAAWFQNRYKVETMMVDRNAEPGKAFDTIEVSMNWASAAACTDELDRLLADRTKTHHLHFSHAYSTGVCLYCLLWLAEPDDAACLASLSRLWTDVKAVVARHGGMVGHHHGIGGARAIEYASSADGRVHALIKHALDPNNIMHARLLDARPLHSA